MRLGDPRSPKILPLLALELWCFRAAPCGLWHPGILLRRPGALRLPPGGRQLPCTHELVLGKALHVPLHSGPSPAALLHEIGHEPVHDGPRRLHGRVILPHGRHELGHGRPGIVHHCPGLLHGAHLRALFVPALHPGQLGLGRHPPEPSRLLDEVGELQMDGIDDVHSVRDAQPPRRLELAPIGLRGVGQQAERLRRLHARDDVHQVGDTEDQPPVSLGIFPVVESFVYTAEAGVEGAPDLGQGHALAADGALPADPQLFRLLPEGLVRVRDLTLDVGVGVHDDREQHVEDDEQNQTQVGGQP
mmetsp:Transcript_75494/g.201828  ORF Transcript_75494/g.201828 Transcript_75494/m.201828 type:complete len:303 (-) Transcript_75494:1596-2504(-)